MLLYHFTFQRFLPAIAAEGLVPQGGDMDPPGAVWLTTNPQTIYASDQHGNLLAHAHDCRIELVIPSHDRRLINWRRWLRKHQPGGVEHYLCNPYLGPERSRLSLQEWHCYFGILPPNTFRAVERREQKLDALHWREWIGARVE